MNKSEALFWNGYYNTARNIGMSVAESIHFADLQLEKLAK